MASLVNTNKHLKDNKSTLPALHQHSGHGSTLPKWFYVAKINPMPKPEKKEKRRLKKRGP